MKPAAAKEKSAAAIARARATGPTRSYLQTRVRASRLLAAARILAIIELTRRLHQAYEQAYDQQAADWVLPQNIVTVPLGDLKGNLDKILKQPGCEEYTTKLLAQAAKMFAGDLAHINTVREGFDKIRSQGDYILKQTAFDTVNGDLFANGVNGTPPGAVWLVPNRGIGSLSAQRIAEFQADYAYTAFHETFHLGKRGWYTDEQMARAAYALAGKDMPETYWNAMKHQRLPISTLTPEERVTVFTTRFDEELMIHCPKLKQ